MKWHYVYAPLDDAGMKQTFKLFKNNINSFSIQPNDSQTISISHKLHAQAKCRQATAATINKCPTIDTLARGTVRNGKANENKCF